MAFKPLDDSLHTELRYGPTPQETSSSTIILIELYAFVTESYRDGNRQFFTFADLFFPLRPPYLSGVWEGLGENTIHSNDGQYFLEPNGKAWRRAAQPSIKMMNQSRHATSEELSGRMCRVIGTLTWKDKLVSPRTNLSPKECNPVHPKMKIFRIWAASWEDVEYVKGIVQT
jgi:hypothetical protein